MAATLWASAADRRRIGGADSSVLLVGGYDGSGNFGDVLQLAAAIETVRGLSGSPLPIAVVERETHAHHTALLERHPAQLGGAAFVHYHEGGDAEEDGLLEVEPESAPNRSALYLYGGGYVNGWWGHRKAAHADAAERLAGTGSLPVVASGLQADAETVAPDGAAHKLLSRASWIGVRDALSLEHVRAHVIGPVELCGDDSVPCLRFPPVPVEPVVNLHLNPGEWVSEDTNSVVRRIVGLLQGLGDASPHPLQLQPVIAYEDPRVSERRAVSALLEEHGEALEGAGLTPSVPVDLLADATGNELRRFRRARLTVACSYHVTLTSLLGEVPPVLLADNAYYGQKAAGLRDLFGLDRGLLGIEGRAADAAVASGAALDGSPRAELLDRLRVASGRVVERYERGRKRVASALATALRRNRLRRTLRWGRAA